MVTKLQPVEGSSNIAEQGYDTATQTLAVRFKGKDGRPGKLYHYAGVEPEVATEFAGADSLGSYLAVYIRGSYEATPIPEDEAEGE
jgi:hypothetical protein